MPGVSLKLAFKEKSKDQSFFLFNKRHKDLDKTFRENNVGGPALIFDRYQEVGEFHNIFIIVHLIFILWSNCIISKRNMLK